MEVILFTVYLCQQRNKQKQNIMKNATITIESELKRRMDLVNDKDFRTSCAEHSKGLGITPKEWNENKAMIIMKFANDFCAFENSKNK